MIAIVDYQMGNLRSVQKGFEKAGHPAEIVSDPVELAKADKVVLPGVGAFADAIAELRRRDLVGPILDAIGENKPFLGIGLGRQMVFGTGEMRRLRLFNLTTAEVTDVTDANGYAPRWSPESHRKDR